MKYIEELAVFFKWGQVNGYAVMAIGLFLLLVVIFSLRWVPYSKLFWRRRPAVVPELQATSSSLFAVKGLCAVSLVAGIVLHPGPETNTVTAGLFGVFVTFLVTYIIFLVASRVIIFNYGDAVEQDDKTTYEATIESRRFTIAFTVVLVAAATLVAVSLFQGIDYLKASGIIALIAAIFTLSQGAWFPDYMHGLVILFSEIYKKGDTVSIEENGNILYAQIYNVKACHTELISYKNRRRIVIKNSRMRGFTLENLSRVGGSKGLREELIYNIGYDVAEPKVRKMFEAAFCKIEAKEAIAVQKQHEHEVRLLDAGDHALRWGVYYYTKQPKELTSTKQRVAELILETSIQHGISLSTPTTHEISIISHECLYDKSGIMISNSSLKPALDTDPERGRCPQPAPESSPT